MTVLPVNVDTTYADDGTDASVKLHQQHHDRIHAAVNSDGFAVAGTTDGVSMTLTYSTTPWGISATTGCPYYNDADVTSGDEAIFTVGSDGSLALVQL